MQLWATSAKYEHSPLGRRRYNATTATIIHTFASGRANKRVNERLLDSRDKFDMRSISNPSCNEDASPRTVTVSLHSRVVPFSLNSCVLLTRRLKRLPVISACNDASTKICVFETGQHLYYKMVGDCTFCSTAGPSSVFSEFYWRAKSPWIRQLRIAIAQWLNGNFSCKPRRVSMALFFGHREAVKANPSSKRIQTSKRQSPPLRANQLSACRYVHNLLGLTCLVHENAFVAALPQFYHSKITVRAFERANHPYRPWLYPSDSTTQGDQSAGQLFCNLMTLIPTPSSDLAECSVSQIPDQSTYIPTVSLSWDLLYSFWTNFLSSSLNWEVVCSQSAFVCTTPIRVSQLFA